jgi:hypothetical protein
VKPVLVISERDNVATALQALEPGRDLTFARGRVSVDAVPSGHKMRLPIHAGAAISTAAPSVATVRFPRRAYTHNLASTQGRGDLRPRRLNRSRAWPSLRTSAMAPEKRRER